MDQVQKAVDKSKNQAKAIHLILKGDLLDMFTKAMLTLCQGYVKAIFLKILVSPSIALI